MRFKDFITSKDYKIYVDLDGVLCDFGGQFESLGHGSIKEVEAESKEKFWKIIKDEGVDFWSKMPWFKDSQKLWNYLKDHYQDIQILSALSKEKESEIGKKEWINRELGDVKAILVQNPKEKQQYANDKAILIDDMEKNIKQWKDSGGIGILFQSAEQVISKLKELR